MASSNRAVLAAAGSGKTAHVVDEVARNSGKSVLVTTFTVRNTQELERRLAARADVEMANVTLQSWFSLLIAHGARPFQADLLGKANELAGFHFSNDLPAGRPNKRTREYYMTASDRIYSRRLADFVVDANAASNGAVVDRIARIFDVIIVDEVQDLSGYDWDILELLFESAAEVILVGDLRQDTLDTHHSPRNPNVKGPAIGDWLDSKDCHVERDLLRGSHRCGVEICELASRIFDDEPMHSLRTESHEHAGVFSLSRGDVHEYFERHRPQVLRYDKRESAMGLPAANAGEAKGGEWDHVLIFPTRPWKDFLGGGSGTCTGSPEKLYVAVTRARHSVAYVID